MKFFFTCICQILLFTTIYSQSISSLNTGRIVELECIQSPTSNTFIATSMERNPIDASDQKTIVHRSIDYGQNWTFIDSFVANPDDSTIADPVIAVDENGYFYFVHMRVLNSSSFNIHLEIYRSMDDGLSWNLMSKPYSGTKGADYPQLIAKGDGEIYLVYSLYDFSLSFESTVQFIKSNDGGESWSDPVVFECPKAGIDGFKATIGPDLIFGENGKLIVSYCGYNDETYSYYSLNDGEDWSEMSTSTNHLNEETHISKPIANVNHDNYCILSHKPHQTKSSLSLHLNINNEWSTTDLGQGAYAQGLMSDDGVIHIIYNQLQGGTFSINYVFSEDKGISFSESRVLYSAPFRLDQSGEYQSLIMDQAGNFYLAFCDWADHSDAKFLIFNNDPLNTKDNGLFDINIYPIPTNEYIHIEVNQDHALKTIHILSMEGAKLASYQLEADKSKYKFDLSSLSAGTYTLLIEEENRYISKLIQKL